MKSPFKYRNLANAIEQRNAEIEAIEMVMKIFNLRPYKKRDESKKIEQIRKSLRKK